MPSDTLDIDERFKVLRIAQQQYHRASRAERGRLLDHLEALTGLHRKSLIRLLRGPCARTPRRAQRGRTYGAAVDDALRVIAETHDYICAERLQPNLVAMAEQLERHGELVLDAALRADLERISVSTVRRHLARLRQDEPRLKRRPHPPVARQGVPIRRIPWNEPEPGHFEADLVHHSGPEASGEYLHTLHLVDVTTGWSEAAAVLGRSYRVVRDGFCRCLARLPFAVREVHTDNGSEFFNAHMTRFFGTHLREVERSRNRPNHSNDARFVEHGNGDLIRGHVGHGRLDTAAQAVLLNAIYDKLWLYHNFFQPVLRLERKEPSEDGQRITRRFSPARTPFERLCAARVPGEDSPVLAEGVRQELEARRLATNPRALRRELHALLEELWRLPHATPGCTEDVFATLYDPSILEEGGGSPR